MFRSISRRIRSTWSVGEQQLCRCRGWHIEITLPSSILRCSKQRGRAVALAVVGDGLLAGQWYFAVTRPRGTAMSLAGSSSGCAMRTTSKTAAGTLRGSAGL